MSQTHIGASCGSSVIATAVIVGDVDRGDMVGRRHDGGTSGGHIEMGVQGRRCQKGTG